MYSLPKKAESRRDMSKIGIDADLASKLKARVKTPRAEFVNMDENDKLFADIRTKLNNRSTTIPKEELD